MKFLFDDESFSFETLRAAGFAPYGGADLGEILVTADAIINGDEASWHQEWKATADRVRVIGEGSLAAGHRVSAREALLRASNYYRVAEFFLREHPASDPEVTLLSTRAQDTFVAAINLLDTPVETISILCEGTTLPGYLFLVDDSGTPRPTVIYNNGYDSTAEESYFAIAAAALRRGYNVLAFDGPGMGATARAAAGLSSRLGGRDHTGDRLCPSPRGDRRRPDRAVRLQPRRLPRGPSRGIRPPRRRADPRRRRLRLPLRVRPRTPAVPRVMGCRRSR